ncbi:MAG: hypothetical protein VX026_07710, partial [Myxococcota bacterium]|nr:hypothetical protein [Myxococcota bacterium]
RLNVQIKLPIMSFNTTSDKIQGQIKATVVGGSLSKSAMSISLPPYGTFKSETILTAKESGLMDIQVSLRGVDTVNDHIKVYPLGQKMTSIESGILNARHNFKWKPTQTAISSSSRLQLSIYPGAIGFFRSELRRSLGNDLSSNVYSIVMSERMKALALEMELEESFEALDRQIEQNAQQLFFNLSKSHENAQSVFLLEAFLSVKDNLVMHRMGMSMANRIADSQLPDGTFQSNSTLYETPTTVQEHLVTMAKSAMIFRRIAELEPELKPRANRVIQLINQGITRLWKQHQDGYTAAWLIVAELGTEMEQEQWKLAVKETLTDIDGLWNIAIPDVVKSPGGGYPSLSEYQALASVVLQSDAEISAYLLSQVMTSYNPQSGWGNNLRNEIVFHCITQNISQALPDQITLSIYENDRKVSSTVVKKESLQDLVFIDIPLDQDSRNQWHLMAAPHAPSMSFAASFIHYEPFSDSLKEGDIALEWKRPKSMSANQPTPIPITLSLPSQTPFNLRLSLPTGVKITPESKQSLETSYTIKQTDEELSISGISSDKTITQIKLSFIAQFKGRISGGAHVLETDLGQFTMAPQTWTIK